MSWVRCDRVVLGIAAITVPIVAIAASQAPAVVVEPSELAKRPDLVGHEISVDDRIRYFLESRKGEGFDELILKRTDVPFRLSPRARFARPPVEPNVVVRAVLRVVDGHLVGDVLSLELLPTDTARLDREVSRTRAEDFAAKRSWALWAERRGRELNEPKLGAMGAAIEADALWIEASRPGADPIALADGAADRPIPRLIRDALYHRGFRRAATQAATAADLDAMAHRVGAVLPRSVEPKPGHLPTPTPPDDDPATAYRATTDDERAWMDRRLYADLLEKSLAARLVADPARASALAEEATRSLPDRPGVADQLRQRGLAEAELGVASMRQSEVEDLARKFRADGQDDRARRVLADWLADRRNNRLSATDAEGRTLLAANYEKLLGDRAAAGDLLNEAYKIDPQSKAVADAFLRLGFRQAEDRWFDPTVGNPAPAPGASTIANRSLGAEGGDSLRGLTRAQTRSRMGGKPDRINRSATQGILIEQWIYRTGKTEQFILFQIDATTTEPRVTASYSASQDPAGS